MSDKATIRPTVEDDLEGIAALFPRGKSLGVLRWLLSDPNKPKGLRSWVAVDRDRIVGHCGYITSEFLCGASTLTGCAPVEWTVLPEYQGTGLGGQLIRQAFSQGDFVFTIGGSAPARRAYPRLGYQRLFDLTYFVKILDPLRYVIRRPARLRVLATTALLAWASRGGAEHELSQVSVLRLRPEWYCEGHLPMGYNANVLPWPHLAWALRCPVLEAQAFHIEIGEQIAGTALCYINQDPGGPPTARLTHMSYLGEAAATWRAGVAGVEEVLRARGCTMISVLASHPAFVTALADLGFVARNHPPLWLRDPANVVPRQGWHLTAVESDIGHRGV